MADAGPPHSTNRGPDSLIMVWGHVNDLEIAGQKPRALEACVHTLPDSAPIILWVTDAQGRNTFVNQALLDFFGIVREQSSSFDWAQAIHPDDRQPYVTAFQAALRERRSFQVRVRARRRDGMFRWLETRGQPQLDATGELGAFIGCSPDITEILEAQRALQEADRHKDEFLAVLTHELRNRLASILSAARLLQRVGASQPALSATCDIIGREANRLSRLIDDLLDVSRITADRLVLRKETIDTRAVARRAVETSEPQLEARRHRLSISLSAESLLIEERPASPPPGPRSVVPRRVLLIDDNQPFVLAMSGLLAAMGHYVRVIHQGAAALETATDFGAQVVLLDIGLPGIRGFDVARALRRDPALAGLKIIATTGCGREQDKEEALAAGIDHYLTKPVDDQLLARLIDGPHER